MGRALSQCRVLLENGEAVAFVAPILISIQCVRGFARIRKTTGGAVMLLRLAVTKHHAEAWLVRGDGNGGRTRLPASIGFSCLVEEEHTRAAKPPMADT